MNCQFCKKTVDEIIGLMFHDRIGQSIHNNIAVPVNYKKGYHGAILARGALQSLISIRFIADFNMILFRQGMTNLFNI